MTITFSCSNCQKSVSTPDAMAGKKGKCPTCGNIIEIPAAPTSSGFTGGSAPTSSFGNSGIPSNNPLDDLGSFGSAMPGSGSLPPTPSSSPFGQGLNPYAAPSLGSSYGNYQGGSQQPQAWPIVVPGSIQLVGNILAIIYCIINTIVAVPQLSEMADKAARPGEREGVMIGGIGILILMPIGSLLGFVGSICMISRRFYGMAVTGAIFSMIGCACIFFPVGLWSLIVLCMADYKRQFR